MLFSAAFAAPYSSITATAVPYATAPTAVQNHAHSSSEPTKLPHFKGIGNASGKIETGFLCEKESKKFEEKNQQSGIKFSPHIQKLVDNASKTIKDIDESTLKAVQSALDVLGIEAQSARIRPSHGGIGLGISIKLDDKEKTSGE